jgi:tRNA-splicing ligase RtcB
MMDRVLTEVRRAVHGEDNNAPPLELQRIKSHQTFTHGEEHFGSRVRVTRRGAIEARRSNWAMTPARWAHAVTLSSARNIPMSFHPARMAAELSYSRAKAPALFGMDDLSRAMAGIEYGTRKS